MQEQLFLECTLLWAVVAQPGQHPGIRVQSSFLLFYYKSPGSAMLAQGMLVLTASQGLGTFPDLFEYIYQL